MIRPAPADLIVVYASGRTEEKRFPSHRAAQEEAKRYEKLDTVKSVTVTAAGGRR